MLGRGSRRGGWTLAVCLSLGCTAPPSDAVSDAGLDAAAADAPPPGSDTAEDTVPDTATSPDSSAPAEDAALADVLPSPDLVRDTPGSTPVTPRPAAADWRWENPWPQGRDIHGLWGSSASDVWAVGERGLILHFDGREWTPVPSGVTATLTAIWGAAADDVYAAMGTSELLHFDGDRWSPIPAGGPGAIHTVTGASGDLLVAGDAGLVRRRHEGAWSDLGPGGHSSIRRLWSPGWPALHAGSYGGGQQGYDGNTWEPIVVSETTLPSGRSLWSPMAVWGTSGSNLYATSQRYSGMVGGPHAGIHHFDGLAWTQVADYPDHVLSTIVGSGPRDLYAVGSMVARGDGERWTPQPIDDPNPSLTTAWSSGPGELFAAGHAGALYRVSGAEVTRLHRGWTAEIHSAHGVGPEQLYAIGSVTLNPLHPPRTLMLRSGRDGWTEVPSPAFDQASCLWATAPDEVHVLAGWQGTHHLFRDGTWTRVGELPGGCNQVWGLGSQLYAVSRVCAPETLSEPCVRRFDGQSWSRLGELPPELGSADVIWASAPDQVIVAGWGWSGRYDGATWTLRQLPGGDDPRDLWGSGPDDVYLARNQSLAHWNGLTWRAVDTGLREGTPLRAIWGEDRDSVYVVGDHGLVHWNGVAWTPVTPTPALQVDEPLHDVWASGAGDVRVFGTSGRVLRGQTARHD